MKISIEIFGFHYVLLSNGLIGQDSGAISSP